MPGWISSILAAGASILKLFSRNQDIINSPAVVKAKVAKQDAAERDEIHKSTQAKDIESARNDFSH